MMITDAEVRAAPAASRARLLAEFAALYLCVPAILAFGLGPRAMWGVMGAGLAAALVLLAATPGVRARDFLEGPLLGRRDWLLGFAAGTAAVAVLTVNLLAPHAFLALPRWRPELWAAIMVLYPLLSALPQEVMFRMLFFRRYEGLFPGPRTAAAANAGVFALAHAFLWNLPSLAMTFCGGLAFAAAYRFTGRGRNLWFAVLLHAIAGWIVFTVGLGRFFYHGAAPT